jgi:SAM-dependent methyltransferase
MATLADIEERVIEGQSPSRVFVEHLARYEFAVRFASDRRVLDVACGSGYGSSRLLKAGAREVVGVDAAADVVEYATNRYGRDGIRFLTGDAHDPPVTGPFDLIVSFETVEHLERPQLFLQSCRDLLAPNGVLLVSTPYRHDVQPDGRPVNPFHRQEWRTEDFAALLRNGFASVEMYGQALKLEKRRFQLNRRWAAPLAWLQGHRLRDPWDIYPLPGPRFGGLWRPYPAYLLAVCRT